MSEYGNKYVVDGLGFYVVYLNYSDRVDYVIRLK